MAELEQPIIIKKIYKNEEGHHGGAWKVAYADFVTAMMAFFLMLWLISSASDAQLEGIADYFTPTIGLKDQMGIGFQGGRSNVVDEGKALNDLTSPGIVSGQPPQGIKPTEPKKEALVNTPNADARLFEQAAAEISQMFAKEGSIDGFKENVLLQPSAEGLRIQITDTKTEPMFHPGQVHLTKAGQTVVREMTRVIRGMPNHISITGHTDASGFTERPDYGNWELSTGRANAARRFMMKQGMVAERVARIQGRADKELLLPNEPMSPKNRRIEIVLLRGDHLMMPRRDAPSTQGRFLPQSGESDKMLKLEEQRKQEERDKELQMQRQRDAEQQQEAAEPITIIPDQRKRRESFENQPSIPVF